MSGVSQRGKRSPRYNFIRDALERIRFEFSLAAQLLAKLDELPLPDDEQTSLAVCNSLVSAIVLQVTRRLRPDLLAAVGLPARARYKEDLLPPAVRERVHCMLVALLACEQGTIQCSPADEEQRLALAVNLVEATVAEIAQHVLDKPIASASAVTHTLNLVSAYLRDLAARECSDRTRRRAAQDILYLIVWGTSSHYLAAPAKERRRGDR